MAFLRSDSQLKSIIAPSALASDFGNLSAECRRVMNYGAEMIHMDVMDGHFVPNISMGAPVLESVKRSIPEIFMDCHMMVSRPEQWVEAIASAGGSLYTFHYESTSDHLALIKQIRAKGMKVGIAISPETPTSAITDEIAELVDMILVMLIVPGKGGQKLIPSCLPKVTELRERFRTKPIEVDGGVGPSTIQSCAHAGANVIVAGTAIFHTGNPEEVIKQMRAVVDEAISKRNCHLELSQ